MTTEWRSNVKSDMFISWIIWYLMILVSIFDIHIPLTVMSIGYQFQSYVHNLFSIFENELANKKKQKKF